MGLKVKTVAFYTLGPYAEEAKKLLDSCDRFGVDLDLSALPKPLPSTAGWRDWHDVVTFKPKFILSMLEKHKDVDGILYTDADSVFARVPDFSVFDGAHVAFHKFRRTKNAEDEFLSGTMYFANTPTVREFVSHWAKVTPQYRYKFTPEQDSLKSIWGHWGEILCFKDPGPEWCWIFDDSKKIYGHRESVVVHFQASRRNRGSASG